MSEGVQSLGRQGWHVGVRRSSVTGKTRVEWKYQEFSQWEDKAGMDGSVRRSSVTGKTRLEWTGVQSVGRQGWSVGRQDWNEQKCQKEFSHWEDKVGMDGSVRRSSVK